ncbi:MAG: 4-hydroxy-3-methylbut-2-enyl diphosphate reductase [Acidaminococcaceae bacterium]
MEIKIATTCGFCYGVKRAVALAQTTKLTSEAVATFGPLIHNPQMIAALAEQGIGCLDKLDDFSTGTTIILRSHGVGPEVYKAIQARNLKLVDATCPNVLNAQKRAAALAEEGYLPIIVGEKAHPEVTSIQAWAGNKACVIETLAEINNLPYTDKYGVIIQTTFELSKFEEILLALQNARPGIYKVERTICNATSERQKAALQLASTVDVVIVLGGKNSANTKHLYELVHSKLPRTYHLETAAEIKQEMLKNCKTIGITAGASTPDWLIEEAIHTMENMETMETMESLLEQEEVLTSIHGGMSVKGEVIHITKEGAIVNFGYPQEGLITFAEWGIDATKESIEAEIAENKIITAKVIANENKDGFVALSRLKAEADLAWEKIGAVAEEKKILTVKGLKAVKGGLTVLAEGVVAFIPASHLELRRIEDISIYVGKTMDAEVIEFNPDKKRLVLSRRNLLRTAKEATDKAYYEERAAKMEATKQARLEAQQAAFTTIHVGDKITGTVKKIAEFGIFVEIATGLQGLVHSSELSWQRNQKPADICKEGESVEVVILKIDEEAKRVSLSIKALTEDPWLVKTVAFKEGQLTCGTVERFLAFGAIVKLVDGVEGLVHISEIAEEHIAKPEDVLKLGQEVKVKIIKIDKTHKKIGLSITKAVNEEAEAEYSAFLNEAPQLSTDIAEKLSSINTEA